jgi:hypothetical protein
VSVERDEGAIDAPATQAETAVATTEDLAENLTEVFEVMPESLLGRGRSFFGIAVVVLSVGIATAIFLFVRTRVPKDRIAAEFECLPSLLS